MKACKERVHLSDDLSFIAEVNIMIGVRDHENVSGWYSALEVIGPGSATDAARSVEQVAERIAALLAQPVSKAEAELEVLCVNARHMGSAPAARWS